MAVRSIVLILVLGSCCTSSGQEFVITKIADTNTPIPGGRGTFGILSAPRIIDGKVLFKGGSCQRAFCPYDGIYSFADGSLVPLVDIHTNVPGTQSAFNIFADFEMDGPNLVFMASAVNKEGGIFLKRDGEIPQKIAGRDTPVPHVPETTFKSFGGVISGGLSLDGDAVAFRGDWGLKSNGVFLYTDGEIIPVATTETPMPDGMGNFGGFLGGNVSLEGNTVVFSGCGPEKCGGFNRSPPGIYQWSSGVVSSTLVDVDSPIVADRRMQPHLKFFQSGPNIMFRGQDSDDAWMEGIYLYHSDLDSFETVVDTNTAVPDWTLPGDNTFHQMTSRMAIDGQNIAFTGRSPWPRSYGLYAKFGDSPLTKVFAGFSELGNQSIDGNTIVFSASDGIYRADLNEQPPPPVVAQNVFIDWNSLKSFEQKRVLGFPLSSCKIVDQNGSSPVDSTQQEAIVDYVKTIFANSFGDVLESAIAIHDSSSDFVPDEDTVVVHFADEEICGPGQIGFAYDISKTGGIDRFNDQLGGDVAVYIDSLFEGNDVPAAERIAAQYIAHEVGHALGLRHVNPNREATVMDYDWAPDSLPTFANEPARIKEPPTLLGWPSRYTHNPAYHVRRHVLRQTDEELRADGFEPGTWDVPEPETRRAFDIPDVLKNLFNLAVLIEAEEGIWVPYGIVDDPTVEEALLDIPPDLPFLIVASTTPDATSFDISFGTGSVDDPQLIFESEDNLPVDATIFRYDTEQNIFIADETLSLNIVGFLGDFNRNGVLDAADIDALFNARNTPEYLSFFDLNGDQQMSTADYRLWVEDIVQTYFGDANLDGEFDTSDMIAVFQTGTYEQDIDAGWAAGDWTGDNRFDTADLIKAFQHGGYEQGPRPVAVPEPSGSLLLIGVFLNSEISRLMLSIRRLQP